MNNVSEYTKRTFELAKRNSGWHTLSIKAVNIKKIYHIPDEILALGPGWERAQERTPKAGYVYGVQATYRTKGFRGVAARTYYSMFRRLDQSARASTIDKV